MNVNFHLTGFQDPPSRYDLIMKDNKLHVIDTKSNTDVAVTKTKNNKYSIKTETGYKYFY